MLNKESLLQGAVSKRSTLLVTVRTTARGIFTIKAVVTLLNGNTETLLKGQSKVYFVDMVKQVTVSAVSKASTVNMTANGYVYTVTDKNKDASILVTA